MNQIKSFTVLIPVFRNEGSLVSSYSNISNAIKTNYPDLYFDFVFVDDGSDDNSFQELTSLKKENKNLTIIKFSRNFGQFSAINAGLNFVKGDAVGVISADEQDPPEIIPKMIKEINKGNEIVLARRIARNDSFFKNLTARFHVSLIRMSTPTYPEGGFDCWCLSKKALQSYKKYSDIIRTNQIDILNLGYKKSIVDYERKKREVGVSQYNFSKRLKVSLNQILATSYWPLRLVSLLGFITTTAGFIFGSRVFYAYFTKGTPFQGYTPIILLQLLIGGIIMLMLGVIGEYQWRIYFETKKRPLFIIDEVIE